MWDLPGPGIEPVSPALAGGFLSTAPPGKPFMDVKGQLPLKKVPGLFRNYQLKHFSESKIKGVL